MTTVDPADDREDDGAPFPGLRVLEGLDAVRGWYERLHALAQREVLCVDSPGRGVERLSVELAHGPLSRGVTYRTLAARSTADHDETVARMRDLQRAGAEFRFADTVPVPALVVDRRIALMPLRHKASDSSWVLLRESPLVQAAATCFQSHWAHAFPLAVDGRADDSYDVGMLRLMASGLKDDAVGRQLRISSRTVLRRMDRLMQQLGARTRFQAGVLAAKNGWIP
jgi:hypothetical protein